MFYPIGTHTPKNLYEMRVSKTLAGFQIIEFMLKAYIATYCKEVKPLADGSADLSFTGTVFENYPLRKLIATFKKSNKNQDLIKSLIFVVAHRNQIAHRAFLPLYWNKKLSDQDYWRLIDEVAPMADQIEKILGELQLELEKLNRAG